MFENRDILFYLILIIALLLPRIPVLGKYFKSVNTLIHEAGHAFATLLLSGEVISVNLFADTSGNTLTKSKNKFSQVIISLTGYTFSSFMALLFMFLVHKQLYPYILFIVTSIALLLMILSIKNAYGLFWAGTFITLNLLTLYFNNEITLFALSLFYTFIILSDSVISAIIVLILSIRQPKKAGDTTNLHKTTGIPAVIWGLFFSVVACFVAYIAVSKYFPLLTDLLKLI